MLSNSGIPHSSVSNYSPLYWFMTFWRVFRSPSWGISDYQLPTTNSSTPRGISDFLKSLVINYETYLLRSRVIQARKCIACLNGILWSRDIRKERTLNIYNALIKSSLLCGSGNTETHRKYLQTGRSYRDGCPEEILYNIKKRKN